MTFDLKRRLFAEALGTCLLVAVVVGSGIMAETLSGGNVALALLGNTLATGAILVVLILVFGGVSGAHFNPAVTFVFALRRELAVGVALAYVGVQIIGGIAGTWLAHGMFEQPIMQASAHIRTGLGQWLSEGAATFALVAAILGALRWAPQAVPYAVGLVITAGYWWTASTSFANPAVAIARGLTDTFSGIAPVDIPGFIAAQLIGAAAASGFFAWLYRGTPAAAE